MGTRRGRQWFFEEADPDERTMTDGQLIERIRELTTDAATWHDPEGVWFYIVGRQLGELSGNLFHLPTRSGSSGERKQKKS